MPEVEHVRIAREAYERWRRTPNREAYVHNEFGNATLAAYRAGREDAARDLERPDSILCNCPRLDSVPTNPKTGATMDHHCDCRAVEAAATMLGAYSRTVHAGQCVHGTEFDKFYRRDDAERADGDPTNCRLHGGRERAAIEEAKRAARGEVPDPFYEAAKAAADG